MTAADPSAANVFSPIKTSPHGRLRLETRGDVDGVADDAVLAVAAPPTHDADEDLAAVHADPEAGPARVVTCNLGSSSLQLECRLRGARGVIGRVTCLVEDDHQLVSDDLMDVAAHLLHQRENAVEVGVQHRGHLGRIVLLAEARETREVGQQHAHLLRTGERLVEVERAEALLVPLGPGGECDREECREHQYVPLPPGEVPVARPGDRDHRLREQRERDGEGEHEARATSPVEPDEAHGRERIERDPERREHELPAVELLLRERAVEGRELCERDQRPERHGGDEGAEERALLPHDRQRALAAQLA
jgi:hypothetical protein